MSKQIVTNGPGMQLSLLVSQLIVTTSPQKRNRFNPRPPGVIREGSATEAVLSFLKQSPGFKTEAQILWATKRSHAAVSWALLRLRQWGKVACVEDTARSTRYRRYCAVEVSGE